MKSRIKLLLIGFQVFLFTQHNIYAQECKWPTYNKVTNPEQLCETNAYALLSGKKHIWEIVSLNRSNRLSVTFHNKETINADSSYQYNTLSCYDEMGNTIYNKIFYGTEFLGTQPMMTNDTLDNLYLLFPYLIWDSIIGIIQGPIIKKTTGKPGMGFMRIEKTGEIEIYGILNGNAVLRSNILSMNDKLFFIATIDTGYFENIYINTAGTYAIKCDNTFSVDCIIMLNNNHCQYATETKLYKLINNSHNSILSFELYNYQHTIYQFDIELSSFDSAIVELPENERILNLEKSNNGKYICLSNINTAFYLSCKELINGTYNTIWRTDSIERYLISPLYSIVAQDNYVYQYWYDYYWLSDSSSFIHKLRIDDGVLIESIKIKNNYLIHSSDACILNDNYYLLTYTDMDSIKWNTNRVNINNSTINCGIHQQHRMSIVYLYKQSNHYGNGFYNTANDTLIARFIAYGINNVFLSLPNSVEEFRRYQNKYFDFLRKSHRTGLQVHAFPDFGNNSYHIYITNPSKVYATAFFIRDSIQNRTSLSDSCKFDGFHVDFEPWVTTNNPYPWNVNDGFYMENLNHMKPYYLLLDSLKTIIKTFYWPQFSLEKYRFSGVIPGGYSNAYNFQKNSIVPRCDTCTLLDGRISKLTQYYDFVALFEFKQRLSITSIDNWYNNPGYNPRIVDDGPFCIIQSAEFMTYNYCKNAILSLQFQIDSLFSDIANYKGNVIFEQRRMDFLPWNCDYDDDYNERIDVENSNVAPIIVFPNPFWNNVSVRLIDPDYLDLTIGDFSIDVYNQRMIKQYSTTSLNFNLSFLHKGTYYLIFKNFKSNKTIIKTIIKK